MLNPALWSQSKERESESKIPCRQGSCSVMVSVLDLSLEGWSFEFRWGTFWASNRVCQYVVFLFSCSLPFHNHTALEAVQACAKKNGAWKFVFPQSLSFLQVIGESNVSGPEVYPHIDFTWIGSSPSMCEKKTFIGAWKIVFLQSPISSHKTIRGHATKKKLTTKGNCKPHV